MNTTSEGPILYIRNLTAALYNKKYCSLSWFGRPARRNHPRQQLLITPLRPSAPHCRPDVENDSIDVEDDPKMTVSIWEMTVSI